MPSWTTIVRLLRRRLVLGVIFAVSLTYCALSLLQHESKENIINSQLDDDPLYFSTGKPFLWQMQVLNEIGGAVADEDLNSSINMSNPLKNNCRNSIQGKALIVDERGLVCTRGEVLPSGCCSQEIIIKKKQEKNKLEENDNSNVENSETPAEENLIKRERYSCQTCNPEGCCAVYEYCVSCCLRPSKQIDGKKVSDEVSEKKLSQDETNRRIKRSDNTVVGENNQDANSMKHRFRSLDKFQVCLATCRTSSASVRHENTYKDPNSKHCYILLNQNLNYNNHQRYRRDLHHISNNNNNNNNINNKNIINNDNNNNNHNNNNNGQPRAVLAPFSTVSIFSSIYLFSSFFS